MPSIKTIAFIASLATAAFAYTDSEIYARNDLDFAPEDLEILFGRDAYAEPEAEPENDYEALDHGLEILARGLDLDAREITYLAARDPSILGSAMKLGKGAMGFAGKHKDTLKSVGRHGLSGAGQMSQMYQNRQQMQMMQAQPQQGAYKRDLGEVEDDAELW